jgi:hypothetical protein
MARKLSWQDLTAIPRIQKSKIILDNTLRLTFNPGLFSSSLLSILSSSSGFCTAVETIDSGQVPLLAGQIFHLSDSPSARLSWLAPGIQDHPEFSAVLAELTAMAGERGALQILAEVDQDSPEESLLFKSGFRPYAEQQIWKLPRRFFYGTGKNAWIPITEADIDQVLAYYQRLVPAQIQRVEIPPSRKTIQGLLCWKAGRIVGIALTAFGPRGILVDLILEPDLGELDDYLGALFFHMPYRNSKNIFLRIRSYQQRAASVLERAESVPGSAQNAVVKRLALHYNAKQTFRVQRFEKQPDITTPISNTKIEN